MGSAGPLVQGPPVIRICISEPLGLKLVVVNPHPQKRWLGLGPMDGAELAIERQAAILSQRGAKVTQLRRELWWT